MKKQRLSQKAYEQIKDMIINNRLKPGEIINEAGMQELLGIGRTPIREAFQELARDQLVTIHPRKGIEISHISPKKIHDIFELRELLEPSVLAKGMQNIDREWLAKMRQKFLDTAGRRLTKQPGGILECVRLDDEFHNTLISCIGNQYALEIMNSFLDYLTMIRIATTSDEQRYNASNLEHVGIIDAILNNDVNGACAKLKKHIEISRQATIENFIHSSY